jgi:hypothetical protein
MVVGIVPSQTLYVWISTIFTEKISIFLPDWTALGISFWMKFQSVRSYVLTATGRYMVDEY